MTYIDEVLKKQIVKLDNEIQDLQNKKNELVKEVNKKDSTGFHEQTTNTQQLLNE